MSTKGKIPPVAIIRILMMIAILLGLTIGSAQAFNFGSGDHRGFSRSNKPQENRSLNLSPEQELQLRSLRDKFLEETAMLRTEITRKLSELRTLWADPQLDKEQINAKKKEIIDLYTQIQWRATDNRALAQSFLTPVQAEKLPVFGLRLDLEPNFDLGPGSPSWNRPGS